MELSPEDIILILKNLQAPKDTVDRAEKLLAQEQYQEVYRCLRCLRNVYLDNVHECQKRLDTLDYLLYQVKLKEQIPR